MVIRDHPFRSVMPAHGRGLLPSIALHVAVVVLLPPLDIPVRIPPPENTITVFLVDPKRPWVLYTGRIDGSSRRVAGTPVPPSTAGTGRRWSKPALLPVPPALAEPPVPLSPVPWLEPAMAAPGLVAALATPVPVDPADPVLVPAPADNLQGSLADLPQPGLTGVTPVRVEHPNNGSFDVVIQSSSSELLPETAGLLSGAPVYTVYLPVGGEHPWILQYCLPNAPQPQSSPDAVIITLGRATTPKPPYPRISYAFSLALPGGTAGYFLIHGRITEHGLFDRLRAVSGGDAAWNAAILSLLSRWEFRPASLDGVPIAVEVVVAIPQGTT